MIPVVRKRPHQMTNVHEVLSLDRLVRMRYRDGHAVLSLPDLIAWLDNGSSVEGHSQNTGVFNDPQTAGLPTEHRCWQPGLYWEVTVR